MIAGNVTPKGRAVIHLLIQGPVGSSQWTDAAVDTAYNGSLALPGNLIAALRLPYRGMRKTTLADGSGANVRAFRATVQWHGQPRQVDVTEVRDGALVGMSLLRGSRLTIDVVANGGVRIEPIPGA
jgi:predicted aspartyl protease